LTKLIMRRPAIVAAGAAAGLVFVAIPSLRVQWSGVDASVLPTSKSARVVSDRVATQFPAVDASPIVITASAGSGARSVVERYVRQIATVPGVITTGDEHYDGRGHWLLEARMSDNSTGPLAQHAVSAIRHLPAPFAVSVGGDAAEFHDLQAGIGTRLPLALSILLVLTLAILWAMTGSILLPIKAVVMNALTVGVATGTLVWVFQDGRLNSLLGYRPQGGIESLDFLVLATIVFGLSTDYGVFLLTHIKEERDRGADNSESVALGIQRTSGIVTAAATLLAVAIGAFVTSRLVFLQELGVGVAIAVLADAFIVRTLLVPSLMALLGRWNWWQPKLLHRLHGRVNVDRYLGTVLPATTAKATGTGQGG